MILNAAQKTNLSVTWILGGIATAAVFTRTYVRFFQQHSPGWDDYAMILCWCLAATSASLASTAVHYGLGVNLNDIQNPDDKVNALKYLTLAPSPSILSVAVGKISIVIFFHRLLGVSMTKALSTILWTLIFITVGLSIAAVVAVVAFCIPTESIWDKTITPKSCMAEETQLGIGLAQASFNAFTDIILGLLPAYSFWNLQMPLRRKIGLMMLFAVGVFGCVITSIKAYQLRNLTGHDNLTKSWSPITIWNTYISLPLYPQEIQTMKANLLSPLVDKPSSAEMFVLITCANIPMIRSLFRRIFNIQSSARASYRLESTPQSKSLPGRKKDRYFSLENSQNKTQNTVSASRGTRRNSVDRMYPLTRQDSPPDGGEGETGSQSGIIKGTEISVSYS
ncbi:hypothetical protein BDW59DRAFT_166507 [Aspergillus cavernicola]|uniref:Rhodopsin domain-containing protein n=1 Tax=Aspergillus cavernicola TaxID=176166 RepID=A0ABR4HKP9_9EURO